MMDPTDGSKVTQLLPTGITRQDGTSRHRQSRETSTFAVLLAKYSFGHSTLDFDVRTLQSCKNATS